mmetsp:Transcript_3901/g.14735  ORF Transcript_3901/g.14735 Transcript_3901/m.14735 type:complete len:97 (-) Transcript_3901:1099-1389(-)
MALTVAAVLMTNRGLKGLLLSLFPVLLEFRVFALTAEFTALTRVIDAVVDGEIVPPALDAVLIRLTVVFGAVGDLGEEGILLSADRGCCGDATILL